MDSNEYKYKIIKKFYNYIGKILEKDKIDIKKTVEMIEEYWDEIKQDIITKIENEEIDNNSEEADINEPSDSNEEDDIEINESYESDKDDNNMDTQSSSSEEEDDCDKEESDKEEELISMYKLDNDTSNILLYKKDSKYIDRMKKYVLSIGNYASY